MMEEVLRRYPASEAHFLPDGSVPQLDDTWHRPDMEKTLARLAQAGWRDMYEGELGRKIADEVQRLGGILSREDMAAFEPRLTEPYRATYRDVELYGPILPNGCLSSLQALQMLDRLESIGDGSVAYWHRWAEVLKLIWRDRLRYVGDPDFVAVPIERLLSRDYAAGRVEGIVQTPERVDLNSWGLSSKTMPETLHLSTADSEGNIVAATLTQGGNLGSGVVVDGTGILLAHGMCRFDPRPGGANSVAPYKRPLNNTAPMILRLPDRDIGIGLPGGRRIIAVSAQMAQRLIEFGSSPLQAAAAMRLHVVVEEPVEVHPNMDATLVKGLEEMGHRITYNDRIGGMAHIAECDGIKTRGGGGGWVAGL